MILGGSHGAGLSDGPVQPICTVADSWKASRYAAGPSQGRHPSSGVPSGSALTHSGSLIFHGSLGHAVIHLALRIPLINKFLSSAMLSSYVPANTPEHQYGQNGPSPLERKEEYLHAPCPSLLQDDFPPIRVPQWLEVTLLERFAFTTKAGCFSSLAVSCVFSCHPQSFLFDIVSSCDDEAHCADRPGPIRLVCYGILAYLAA